MDGIPTTIGQSSIDAFTGFSSAFDRIRGGISGYKKVLSGHGTAVGVLIGAART
jgi:hypothetical protein